MAELMQAGRQIGVRCCTASEEEQKEQQQPQPQLRAGEGMEGQVKYEVHQGELELSLTRISL